MRVLQWAPVQVGGESSLGKQEVSHICILKRLLLNFSLEPGNVLWSKAQKRVTEC